MAPPHHQTDTTRLVVIVTPMTKLSLAAQAVWDAFDQDKQEIESIAAVLRAAADQVVPEETWLETEETCYAHYRQRCNTRRELLSIADELEAQ